MAEPWFDPIQFGTWYGSVVGGGGGALVGILGGTAGSLLVPRGIGKPFVLGAFWAVTLFGVASLLTGIFALVTGQPYGIWYPLTLVGFIFSVVCGGLIPTIKARYRQAEQRHLEAESIRAS